MPDSGEGPSENLDQPAAPTTPTAVVERFLEALGEGDVEGAMTLVAPDIEYQNVSLPTVHGRERVRRLLSAFYERGGGFEAHVHAISADGPIVLTERTDAVKFGPLRWQFWICGRFDVRDGQIALWRDYFDWLNTAEGLMRALLGTVIPTLRSDPPSTV